MHAHPRTPSTTQPQPIIASEELRCTQCREVLAPSGDLRVDVGRSLCNDCAFELPCTD